jgi:1,4-dihydroxy-2-naphthoate octaprenyltransferase
MKLYIKALRAPFLAGSIVPVIIGAALAFSEKCFSFSLFLVSVIGVASLHLAANLLNDYYDASGSDPLNMRLTPFSGGSRVIQDGELSAGVILGMSILFFAIAMLTAIYMLYVGKPLAVVIGLLGFFAGWAYSATPLQLMSRGWGEVLIFFAFGPLITLGVYYVMAGRLSLDAFAAGISQGLLITGVIWINQFPDYEADKQAGKRNLVVTLGPGVSRYLYIIIMLLSFVTAVFLISVMGMSYLVMLIFISFPLAFKAMRIAFKEYLSVEGLIPAQALTIQTVIAQGLLLSLGLFLSRFINA